jgi:Flp pilus assembly protein TadG
MTGERHVTTSKPRFASERGMALVHVGIAILVLMAMSSFVLDYGVFWLGRGQAQNGADAGALAGATALAFDSPTDFSSAGPAYLSALNTAQANQILGLPPTTVSVYVDPVTAWSPPTPARCASGGCVQVNVQQTLPTYFASIFGVTSQASQATATAQALPANATNALRPWMIPDLWSPPTPTFNPGVNTYFPPSTGPGTMTGYQPATSLGTQLVLKAGDPRIALDRTSYYNIDVAPNAVTDAIEKGAGAPVKIGDTLTTQPNDETVPNVQGTQNLIAQDPNAQWSTLCSCVTGSAYAVSPRIVPIALFSPQDYFGAVNGTGRFTLTVVNLVALFVENINAGSGDITGRLIWDIGLVASDTPLPPQGTNFLSVVALVR